MTKRTIIVTIITLTIICTAILSAVALSKVQAPTLPAGSSASYSVTLERSPCFGFCPVYKVTIDPEGNVSFFGGRFTSGDYSYRVDQDQLSRLHSQLQSINIFQYNDEYVDSRITDLSSTRLTVSDGLNQKSIKLYGLAGTLPSALIELADLIDAVANTKQWFAAAA